VRVRVTIEYDLPGEVSELWRDDPGLLEFARNDGTWCWDNLIEELRVVAKATSYFGGSCLCGCNPKVEVIEP
jgi:hypothetical protein